MTCFRNLSVVFVSGLELEVDWRRFSNTFISSFAYMSGPLKIQVNWPKQSILAENTLENAKINVFEIKY